MKQKTNTNNISKIFLLISFIFMIIISCKAKQTSIINKVDEAAGNKVLEDSVITNLRNNNDIVIAYADENFAWVRKIDYTILAQQNGVWKGYTYKVSLMKLNPSQRISSLNINKNVCDSLVEYLIKNKAWTIKGDTGNVFCANGNANCNINDASSGRLWIITKKAVINPSYYAPEFYENCCPNKERALFLSIKNKIENSVRFNSTQDSNM